MSDPFPWRPLASRAFRHSLQATIFQLVITFFQTVCRCVTSLVVSIVLGTGKIMKALSKGLCFEATPSTNVAGMLYFSLPLFLSAPRAGDEK